MLSSSCLKRERQRIRSEYDRNFLRIALHIEIPASRAPDHPPYAYVYNCDANGMLQLLALPLHPVVPLSMGMDRVTQGGATFRDDESTRPIAPDTPRSTLETMQGLTFSSLCALIWSPCAYTYAT